MAKRTVGPISGPIHGKGSTEKGLAPIGDLFRVGRGAAVALVVGVAVVGGLKELGHAEGNDAKRGKPGRPVATGRPAPKTAETKSKRPAPSAKPRVSATVGRKVISFPSVVDFAEKYEGNPSTPGSRYTSGKVLKGAAAVRAEQAIAREASAHPDQQGIANACMAWTEQGVAAADPDSSGQTAEIIVGVSKAGGKSEVHFSDPSGGEGSMDAGLARQNAVQLCGTAVVAYAQAHPDVPLTLPGV